ncbi:MAG: recombination mediator RecR [Treponema sp.]|jgi:recombination protein RecR|nr:recombination mediator RecR [Treponema sp.]
MSGTGQTPGQNALDRLSSLLSKLPGIGKKTAVRLVYHILETNLSYAQTLAAELSNLHQAIFRCSCCGSFTETDPCPVCADSGRERFLLCVVERPQDVRIIDESREYKGVFHVLGGLIAPLEGVGPGDLSIAKLLDRVLKEEIKEIILALNPTIEGDTTALYLQRFLKEKLGSSSPEITRLASGLPVGGDLEYADKLTLSRSFRGRVKL